MSFLPEVRVSLTASWLGNLVMDLRQMPPLPITHLKGHSKSGCQSVGLDTVLLVTILVVDC